MKTWLLAALAAIALPAWAAKPVPKVGDAQTVARIEASMQALGGRFQDMDTMANLVMTPPKGSGDAHQNRQVTMIAHLFVKMPDKVKFEVLNSNLPLFNRWIFVQNGNHFLAYDPVSDRQVTTDFQRLTGRQPARVDTSMAMLGLLFDPSRYRFTLLGRTARNGVPVYHVRLKLLKPEQINPITTVAYTDLYMETQRLVPLYSASYDTGGHLATTGDFQDVVKTPVGWAPTRIRITDHQLERLRRQRGKKGGPLKALFSKPAPPKGGPTWLGDADPKTKPYRNGTLDLWIGWSNGVLFPWKMLANDPKGGSTLWTFSSTKVNIGLPENRFKL